MRSLLQPALLLSAIVSISSDNPCLAQTADWQHRVRNLTDSNVNIDVRREPTGGFRNYYLWPGQTGSGTFRASRITVYAVYFGPNGTQFKVKSFHRLRNDGTIHLNAMIVDGQLDIRRGRF